VSNNKSDVIVNEAGELEKPDTYLAKIQDALKSPVPEKEECYLDLSCTKELSSAEILISPLPPADSLITFQEIMMEQIAGCRSDKIKIGINELLKHCLAGMDKEREQELAERYLYRLRMVFKRCLMPDFPFTEEIWNYICDCLRSAGTYLLDREYFIASGEVIDSLAGMGRIAGLKGLPTANTQSSLRMLENKALEKGQKQLASMAKNARFNLET